MDFQMNFKRNKTGVVFGIVTVYIIAAFAWWSIAHIRTSKLLYASKKEVLELQCYKASLDINGAIMEEIVEDSVAAQKYLAINFPKLEIVFGEQNSALDNFLIRPKLDSYNALEDKHNRVVLMYILEGAVMLGLLLWGIIWIFSNLQNKLNLNRQQSNFLLSITHELKTPLASIKLYLETLQKRTLEKEQSATIVGNALSDVQRLRDLVENVLLAAQLDIHKYELQPFETNISELVQKASDRFVIPRALQNRVILSIENDVYLTMDEGALEMVINNLLSNAIKYSPTTGMVNIVLRTDTTHVFFSVSDEGQGILAEEKEMIFSKFYRSGDESTRKTKGTGLGLFIVKNLMLLIKGEIKVKDKQPKGTTFELIFKKDA